MFFFSFSFSQWKSQGIEFLFFPLSGSHPANALFISCCVKWDSEKTHHSATHNLTYLAAPLNWFVCFVKNSSVFCLFLYWLYWLDQWLSHWHLNPSLWGAVQDIIHSGLLTQTHSPFTYIYFHPHAHTFSFHTHIFFYIFHVKEKKKKKNTIFSLACDGLTSLV